MTPPTFRAHRVTVPIPAPIITGRSIRIARLDRDQPTGDRRWLDLGGTLSRLTFTPEVEQSVERFRDGLGDLARAATVTVAFQPSRRMLRVVLGPRWSWDRTRHRQVTRAKYRARARRRSR